MANRKRKYPGIKGRRPDKKFARGVRAKSQRGVSIIGELTPELFHATLDSIEDAEVR